MIIPKRRRVRASRTPINTGPSATILRIELKKSRNENERINAQMRSNEAFWREQAREVRASVRADVIREIAEQEESFKYFLKGAYYEFGQKYGEHIEGALRSTFDPYAAQRKALFDQALFIAKDQILFEPGRGGLERAEMLTMMKIRVPPFELNRMIE